MDGGRRGGTLCRLSFYLGGRRRSTGLVPVRSRRPPTFPFRGTAVLGAGYSGMVVGFKGKAGGGRWCVVIMGMRLIV
jgi:hypothetical protein